MNIKSFVSVIPFIKENTLIICDIDETLLRYKKSFNDFYKIKTKKGHDDAKKKYDEYKRKNVPQFTDYPGFMLMVHILKNKGELVFLTSRSNEDEDTRKELSYLGINDYFKVYYANDKSKGQFIKKHFKIRGKNVLFIDDFIDNIVSVSRIPSIKCFKFI